jgi:enoyl-CoA hydratase/carnithine racemase
VRPVGDLTTYALEDGVATIAMDDGKVNALSPSMLSELMDGLERAEGDGAIVLLTGRAETFSAGFDLRVPAEDWPAMITDGARLAERIMSFPRPVIAACNGNAIAMGAFMLLSCDYRVGVTGEYRIGLNEVAIGMTVPWFGIAIARHRLTRPYFDRCAITGAVLDSEEAMSAGFLDELVAREALPGAARRAAEGLAGVNLDAHAATKLRVRAATLEGIRDGIARIARGEP